MFTGLILATLSGIGWALADVLRKQLTADIEPLRLSIQLALIQLVFVMVLAGAVLIPAELPGWSEFQLDRGYWMYAVPGYICTATGHFLFIKALRSSELSLTIPFLSFSPIFVMGMGPMSHNGRYDNLAILAKGALNFLSSLAERFSGCGIHTIRRPLLRTHIIPYRTPGILGRGAELPGDLAKRCRSRSPHRGTL